MDTGKIIPFAPRAAPKDRKSEEYEDPEAVRILERMDLAARILRGYGTSFQTTLTAGVVPQFSDLNVFKLADLLVEWRIIIRSSPERDTTEFVTERLRGKTVSDDFRQVLINSLDEMKERKGLRGSSE